MKSKITGVISAAILALPFTVHSADWQGVSGQDIVKLLSNKTATGSSYVIYYGSEGEQKGRWGGFVHKAKYYVNNKGHFCNKWLNWDKGKEEGCWSVSHKNGKEVKFEPESGRANKTVTLPLREGNTGSL